MINIVGVPDFPDAMKRFLENNDERLKKDDLLYVPKGAKGKKPGWGYRIKRVKLEWANSGLGGFIEN